MRYPGAAVVIGIFNLNAYRLSLIRCNSLQALATLRCYEISSKTSAIVVINRGDYAGDGTLGGESIERIELLSSASNGTYRACAFLLSLLSP